MARNKIDYGIDLGTTNSAIARMENGEPVIKKTRSPQNDTLPSCVYFFMDKKGQFSKRIGLKAKNSIASDFIETLKKGHQDEAFGYIEFKRAMATGTTYKNSHMKEDHYTPEQLSAEVLKELRSIINDEVVDSIVVTVPAKFNVNQKTATKEAARLAGFTQCELLQEPIAACYAYGITSSQKNGYWLVFDFGGGTFDAALVNVEDGIISITDTEGNNYLGGKNLDEAVVNQILIPKLKETYTIDSFFEEDWKITALRNALKDVAEGIRINLSFDEVAEYSAYDTDMDFGEDDNGEPIEPEFSVTREELSAIIKPIYQEAVNICKTLLKRNNLTGENLSSLVLVGGPTMSPIVRNMLAQQICDKVDTKVDPMTVVARGAALYASTIDINRDKETDNILQNNDVVKLNVGYQSTTVEESQWVSVTLDESNILDEVQVEFERNDKAFTSERIDVNKQGNVIELHFEKGKPNAFKINCYGKQGKLECYPSEITIIPDLVVGNATLPYDIAIGIWNNERERAEISPIKGLERNKTLPATGVDNDRRLRYELRPGNSEDKLVIPIYQADEGGRGKPVMLYDQVCEVVITGDDVDQLIPARSDLHITIKADRSEMMSMEVYFPAYDLTVSKTVDTNGKIIYGKNDLEKEIQNTHKQLDKLENAGIEVTRYRDKLNSLEDEAEQSTDWMKLRDRLRLLRRDQEDLESSTEWERLEKDIRESYDLLERTNNDLGNEETTRIVNQFHSQVEQVIQSKNIDMGRELVNQMDALQYHLARVFYFMRWISNWDRKFNTYRWKNAARAKELINQGNQIISNQPTAEKLSPIIKGLINLLPEDEIPDGPIPE